MKNTTETAEAKYMANLIAHELEEMRDKNSLELDDLDMKKYILSETETREWQGHTLRRVIYTDEWLDDQRISRDCIGGGWIESESNLSQDTRAMVCGDAKVYDNAKVYGDARVYGNAAICVVIRLFHQERHRGGMDAIARAVQGGK